MREQVVELAAVELANRPAELRARARPVPDRVGQRLAAQLGHEALGRAAGDRLESAQPLAGGLQRRRYEPRQMLMIGEERARAESLCAEVRRRDRNPGTLHGDPEDLSEGEDGVLAAARDRGVAPEK